jgi:hypothetical protein
MFSIESMEDLLFKRQGIITLLRNIKSNKSTGPDEIPIRVLKDLAPPLKIAMDIYSQNYKQWQS